jgi:AraC family transcriptional regulator
MDDALRDKSPAESALASFSYREREVHDANGRLSARQLSVIDGGCKEAANDKVMLGPPDLTRPDRRLATVEILPPEFVRRRVITCSGLMAESVQTIIHAKIECSFHGPTTHLLVTYEDGARTDGQTCIQGMPRATLRRFARKFTLVPAGRQYREWHELRVLSRLMYFYFDPAKLNLQPDAPLSRILLTPRLFFEDEGLWHTAMNVKNLIEKPELGEEPYFQALGTVIAYQLLRRHKCDTRDQSPTRGGLAAWQQRIALAYIEEHISERIELATLAHLVRLTPFHFCRAFKQSFGMPPIRYQAKRRIEQAKLLLAMPTMSMTEIGLTVGFGCSSSFTAAFRKATGFTPTEFQRSLG